MDAISVQIEKENPRTNKGVRAEVITLRDHLVGDVRPAVRCSRPRCSPCC